MRRRTSSSIPSALSRRLRPDACCSTLKLNSRSTTAATATRLWLLAPRRSRWAVRTSRTRWGSERPAEGRPRFSCRARMVSTMTNGFPLLIAHTFWASSATRERLLPARASAPTRPAVLRSDSDERVTRLTWGSVSSSWSDRRRAGASGGPAGARGQDLRGLVRAAEDEPSTASTRLGGQLFDEAALADARLAREKENAPLTAQDLAERSAQMSYLLCPSDERALRRGLAGRSEERRVGKEGRARARRHR